MKLELDNFFNPKNVAVVGASSDVHKIGGDTLKNLLIHGFPGNIYPINPRATEVQGLKAYPSIKDVPNEIDLAIIIVPAKFVLSVIQDCAVKRVRSIVIITAGFKEAGKEGKKLQETLIQMSKKENIRIIGPNCQGITNQHNGLIATFGGYTARSGAIAMISQSGSVSGGIQSLGEDDRIGISKLVNLGNKVDINENDLMSYFKNDDNSRVITLYLEGFANGKEFIKIASDVSKVKPIVLLKGGRTKYGMKASLSHTSSLGGNRLIFEAASKQAGVIIADNYEELFDYSKIFSYYSQINGNNIFIIESSGGAGTLASDSIEFNGMQLTHLPDDIKEKLIPILPPLSVLDNPLDLGTAALNPEAFKSVIEINAENETIDIFLIILADPIPNAADVIKESLKKINKPIVVVYFGGFEAEKKEKLKFHEYGYPVYPSCDRAIKSIKVLYDYSKSKKKRLIFK